MADITSNKYEEIAQQMVRECLFEKTEKNYLKCCSKLQSECKAESKPDFANADKVTPYYEVAVLVVLAVLIGAGLYFLAKSKFFTTHVLPHKHALKAISYSWLIWAMCIVTYTYLFDVRIEYWAWFVLPPVCAIAIYFWVMGWWKRPNIQVNKDASN